MSKRKKHCGCTGRSGQKKVMHSSRQRAVWGTLRQGKTGAFRTYPCPVRKGIWHSTHA